MLLRAAALQYRHVEGKIHFFLDFLISSDQKKDKEMINAEMLKRSQTRAPRAPRAGQTAFSNSPQLLLLKPGATGLGLMRGMPKLRKSAEGGRWYARYAGTSSLQWEFLIYLT